MKHDLKIISTNDAQAECDCGFYLVATGERTSEEIKELHNRYAEGVEL